ncbi:hypothetical protein E1B28_010836 [Marasmius oreades]|uniref:Uncharacterized protein n=1 Tax=Marasmius oreades TaxID=181124 RepID=A0A9P7RU82_9AGAR|nr:uncharacterized protein E1B28_010836 [Marasmius oreades]KAG7089128.1 hypothetical protein E1B28_010836 [Marasmius oreades]
MAIQPPELGRTSGCADKNLPSDGSCLNLIVEEPLPIEQIPAERASELERFRSREVVLYLNQHQAEVFPLLLEHRAAAQGYMGDESNVIWCKLVDEDERDTLEALQALSCKKHHIVTLLLPPCLLPTGQYLITIPPRNRGDSVQLLIWMTK